MDGSQIRDLSVYSSGVFPVELSAGKRIDGRHRVPVRASVDAVTGEVHFFVTHEGIKILAADTETN